MRLIEYKARQGARVLYPPNTKPEDVPAFADEDASARHVILSHPFGREHPALEAARVRYMKKGWTVRIQHRGAAKRAA